MMMPPPLREMETGEAKQSETEKREKERERERERGKEEDGSVNMVHVVCAYVHMCVSECVVSVM